MNPFTLNQQRSRETPSERVTVNILGRTRRATLNGREHIVAPLSMIVEGVLNGSKGSLFYPADEIGKNPSQWNGVPLVAYHPTRMGQPVSARDPDVLNESGLGVVLKSRFDKQTSRLLAEGWFDVDAVRNYDKKLPLDARMLPRLEASQAIELSTGLFTRNEKASEGANHRGRYYSHIARDYSPDHLAVLPDQRGACSLQDGCGVMINKEQEKAAEDVFTDVENCDDSGECKACRAKRLAKEKQHEAPEEITNEETELVENCKGEIECPRCQAKKFAQEETTNTEELVDNTESEYFDISSILNCGGEGGTPGPCPTGGDAHAEARKGNREYAKRLKQAQKKHKELGEEAKSLDDSAELLSSSLGPAGGYNRKPGPNFGQQVPHSTDVRFTDKNASKAFVKKHEGKVMSKAGGGIFVRVTHNVFTNLSRMAQSFEGGQLMADKKLTAEDRLKLVDHLVSNSKVWEEEDRETLNALGDVKLYGLAVQEQALNADPEESEDSEDSEDEEGGATENGHMPAALKKYQFKKKGKKVSKEEEAADEEEDDEEEMTDNSRPMTEAEWLAKAPKSLRSVVQNAQRREAAEKQELIANMTDHLEYDQKSLLVKVLNAESFNKLQTLSTLTAKSTTEVLTPVHNYRGQAVPMRVISDKSKVDPNEVLALPTINWKKESKANAS